ncbi:MAG: N-acetyl sugar amidotransferase [Candidatus Woesearchaeota archaeon]|nr:N-acetyl sugar amidotransferase [Candidatus Woesearchaeota archaeon]
MENEKLEVKYPGLPSEIKFCKRCVISNQRPSSKSEFMHNINSSSHTIEFDEEGICAACRYAEKKEKEVDWKKREEELWALCDKFRKNDGSYDCIAPGSGGKDSVMAAHLLKYKFKMHPLTVTWAPHMYTDAGWRNHQRWIRSGFDNILFHPNGKVHRLLTKLAFENLLHPFQPFILGQKNIGAKFAALYNIQLVFYGENEAEYGNPVQDNLTPLRNAKYATGKNYEDMYLGGVKIKELIEQYKLNMNDLLPFLPMDSEEYEKKKIQVHYLGYYIKWDPQEAYYFAVEHTSFEANSERTEGTYSKYNSIDDKSDPYHYYTTLIKFGIGRATYDASQEIRNNKITREEGVALVKKFDHEFPKKYFKDMLEYMDMTEKRFWELIDKFRSPHIWKKEKGEWKLRKAVYDEE